MTMNRSRRFFDLNEAVQLSRRLAVKPSMEDSVRQVLSPPDAHDSRNSQKTDTLDEPDTRNAKNATYLWHMLLEWTRNITRSEGVFALDSSGFLIAAVGNIEPFPPEIFSEAFAAATRLFGTYLSTSQGISSFSLTFEPIGRFELFPIWVETMPVLLGIACEKPLGPDNLLKICKKISGEVADFNRNTATSMGGD